MTLESLNSANHKMSALIIHCHSAALLKSSLLLLDYLNYHVRHLEFDYQIISLNYVTLL